MTDRPDDKPSLSEAARAKRAGKSVTHSERTTLNVNDPSEHAGTALPPDALGEALVDRKLITRQQLFNALNESYQQGSSLRHAVVSLGYITEEELKAQGL